MAALIRGVDHAMVVVRDLDAARRRYEKLGFATTKRGLHGGLGTGNHLIVLEHDYIELLGVLEPDERNLQFQQRLQQREGLWMVALATDDAPSLHRRLADAGVPVMDLFSFKRAVETPGGSGDAAFTLTRLQPGAAPHLGLFFCQHHTPELVWVEAWQKHPNGAVGIREILVTAPDPASGREAYERVFGAGRLLANAAGATLDTGGAPIRFLPPDRLAERFGEAAAAAPEAGPPCAAMSLRVRDCAAVGRLLRDNGVPHRTGPTGAVVVAGAEACGLILEFATD